MITLEKVEAIRTVCSTKLQLFFRDKKHAILKRRKPYPAKIELVYERMVYIKESNDDV